MHECSNLGREGERFYGTSAVGSQWAFASFRNGNKAAVLAVWVFGQPGAYPE